MGQIIARLYDGKYHYGATAQPAPHLGPLISITATGTGTLPPAPTNPATTVEHEQWIKSLERNGFVVEVEAIDEPKAN